MKKKTILIVGSEGLLGKFLISKFQDKYICIGVDIKKISKKNYYCCDLVQPENFRKILKKIYKNNNISIAINLVYPFKSSNFLQENFFKFAKYTNAHLMAYYNFNKSLYDLFKNTKKKKTIINFSSIYGVKVPNFKIYNKTKIKMPIEYAISKSALIMMTKYFNEWSKYNNKKINFFSISAAGIENNESKKFKANYNKFYKKKMLSLNSVYLILNKLFTKKKRRSPINIIITGGAKI